MKNRFTKVIALFHALSCLFSGTALSADISADSNAELVTDELTPAEYAMVYNEANYERDYVSREVFITLKDNVPTVDSYETLFPEVNIASVNVISEKFIVLTLETLTQQSVVDAIDELKDNAYVYAAEPNYKFELASLATVVPNDPYYNSESECFQWHLSHIEADTAWNYTTGSSSIKVGIVDSGIENVDDLESNLDLTGGIDYVYGGNLPIYDFTGHGTHVAGIVGADGNNGIGGSGNCWDVTLIPLRVLNWNNAFLSMDSVVDAINDAGDLGIDILNCSFRSEYAEGLETAINRFAGLIICSAGNDGANNANNTTEYPRALVEECDNIIVVGNSTQSNTRHCSSNYGDEEVHLFAPGVNIYSTGMSTSYVSYTGTSMAAPMVTGAAALIMSEYPNATTAQIKNALIYSVNKYDALEDCCISSGVLNVRRAIEYLSDLHGNGDVTMDGTINNIDLIKLSRYIEFAASEDFSYDSTDSRALNEDQLMHADMNKDNIIDELDTQALGQYLVQRSLNLEIQ